MADQPDMTDQISISMGHELVLSRDILNQVRDAGEFSVGQSPTRPPLPTTGPCHTFQTRAGRQNSGRGDQRRGKLNPKASCHRFCPLERFLRPNFPMQATDFQLDGVFAVTEHGAHSLQPVPVRAGLEWRMYGTPKIGIKWRQVVNLASQVPMSPALSDVKLHYGFCRYKSMPTTFLRGSSIRTCWPCRNE